MARARNIKPGFFTNDVLAECSAFARLLFQGLWCHADREGRMEDRPRKLKAEILPYDDCDIEDLLCQLESRGFIVRYSHGKERFIQVVNFTKHQNPHVKEQESTIPAPCMSGACTVQEETKPEVAGLIVDSLNPITDSIEKPLPDAAPPVPAKKVKAEQVETEFQATCREAWNAYGDAYELKYSTRPVRNAKVSTQVKGFVERVGRDDAIAMAAWFVSHPDAFYVKNMHTFGLLLSDAEKLRTQWVTGRIAQPAAAAKTQRQLDSEATTRAIFGSLINPIERVISGEVVK